eukprot:763409-Hanusia_phi.AAC.9
MLESTGRRGISVKNSSRVNRDCFSLPGLHQVHGCRRSRLPQCPARPQCTEAGKLPGSAAPPAAPAERPRAAPGGPRLSRLQAQEPSPPPGSHSAQCHNQNRDSQPAAASVRLAQLCGPQIVSDRLSKLAAPSRPFPFNLARRYAPV